jgi:hypothetical protein
MGSTGEVAAMLWLCTNWRPDWDAIAAVSTAAATVVALGIASAAGVSRLLEKKGRARTLAQSLLPDVIALETSINNALRHFGWPPELTHPNEYGVTALAFDNHLSEQETSTRRFCPTSRASICRDLNA